MKEILETIDSRIKSPLFGYFTAALITVNWKAFFFLFAENSSAASRISYFETNTDYVSIFVYPAIFAAIFSLTYPWVTYLIMHLCAKPMELKNGLQAHTEHKLLIKRQELEEARSLILSNKERELIDRAKRDKELDEIDDEGVKDNLRMKFDALREERDELISSLPKKPDYEEYKKLMELANDLRKKSDSENSHEDKTKFRNQARELEDRAHTLIGSDHA